MATIRRPGLARFLPTWGAAFALLLPVGSSPGQPPPDGRTPPAREDSERLLEGRLPGDKPALAGLEDRIRAAARKVRAATVRLATEGKRRPLGSGVIVSEDGLILTHGHHDCDPYDEVRVCLADGREVAGHILGTIRSLHGEGAAVRIVPPGKYPHAPLGKAGQMKTGDWCLLLGHPRGPQKGPVLRLGQILPRQPDPGFLLTTCLVRQGDSGGPLFDLDGQVVGICGGMTPADPRLPTSICIGIDWYRAHWADLTEMPSRQADHYRRADVLHRAAGFREVVARARRATVRVLCDGRPRALGVVVGADGLVLTKASEVYGKVECALGDGARLPARVAGVVREHDLALLRVEAKGLPVIEWAGPQDPGVGQLLVTPGPGPSPLGAGVVSSPRQSIPPEPGQLGFDAVEAEGGLKITGLPEWSFARSAAGLRGGDLVTQVGGKPAARWKRTGTGGREPLAGERVTLTVRRAGREFSVSVPLSPREGGRYGDAGSEGRLSYRASGFAAVFGHDTVLGRDECGGPVLDLAGRAVGVNIARAGREVTYAVPAPVIRALLEDLRSGRLEPEKAEP